MNQGKYVFSQLMSFISHNDFNDCVAKYDGQYKVKNFSCWKQFLCMAFGQLTHRESMSDTLICLTANQDKLYHLGIGKSVAKSTLSKANENRDWRIYCDFAMMLIQEAKQLYASENNLELTMNLPDAEHRGILMEFALQTYLFSSFYPEAELRGILLIKAKCVCH